jgi:O-antigen ligase
MSAPSLASRFDRTGLARTADALVVAVAVSLPWSTSATSILLVLWLLALIPTLAWGDVRREVTTWAGALPVLLVLLGVLGMIWADVTLLERWKGLDSFLKLLAIPLLFVQFRRANWGYWVFGGYVVSCIVLLVLSFALALWSHPVFLFSNDYGVPVKSAASQSGEFVTCIFGLLFLVSESVTRRQWWWLLGLLAVLLGMLANIFFVATGRTALVVILVLLVLFAVKKLDARGVAILLASAIVIGVAAWVASPYLRTRTETIWTDFQKYEMSDTSNPSGERVEFAKKSLEFILAAPILGHGTGSITALFSQAAVGKTGAAGSDTANPHNQTFAVAIQVGLMGAIVLWAMWIAHLHLFRGIGLVEWIGFVVVVQNVVGSLFNSHLFDFLQGWVYVLGVGVAGGMALNRRAVATGSTP